MKKLTAFFVCCLVTFFTSAVVFAQEGFTGPSAPGSNTGNAGNAGRNNNDRQARMAGAQAATVAQAKNLPHKTWVKVTGNVTLHLRGAYYTFRDSTGEITVDIERKVWQGLTIGPSDRVEIIGEVEIKKDGRIEVDAKSIRKI